MAKTQARLSADSLKKYVGWTVKNITVGDIGYGDECVGIVLHKGEKEVALWILKDEEGNGAGAIMVVPMS